MKKFTSFVSICFLMLASAGMALAMVPKDTLVKAEYGTVRTLDPATCYDNVGGSRIKNLYETLVEFDGASTENFKPLLATEVPTVANGGITNGGKTYTFNIRKGVKFHNGDILTPEDVEYSLERSMIVDQAGGPSWMLLEALTGQGGTRDGGKVVAATIKAALNAVEVQGNNVILNLLAPYPPLLGILQGSWGSVINKKWAISKGAWDGKLASAMKQVKDGGYNNPDFNKEPLRDEVMGTAPYTIKLWEKSNQFVFERFDDYWGGKVPIKTAIVKKVTEWTARKLMLQNGDADTVLIDNTYVPEIERMRGLTIHKVPQLSVSFALFNQKINPTGNPNIGSGKLDGNGIPPYFFADINVRKAFLHAIDYRAMKEDVANGLIENPGSPNIVGLPYYQKIPVYGLDLEKAKQYMKAAFDGRIWDRGFKMTITHNEGNAMREAAARMMAENIMSLNSKFQIDVRNVAWKDYTIKYRQSLYPIFLIGWGADYPDPHNFLYTFMHSNGVYGKYSHYINHEVDALCEAGIKTVIPSERAEIYDRLQKLWRTDAVGAGIYQPVLVKIYRKGVTGYAPNPMFSDAWELFKNMNKQ
jgi:peptide/nickel transport system substrate-binding protein